MAYRIASTHPGVMMPELGKGWCTRKESRCPPVDRGNTNRISGRHGSLDRRDSLIGRGMICISSSDQLERTGARAPGPEPKASAASD